MFNLKENYFKCYSLKFISLNSEKKKKKLSHLMSYKLFYIFL